MNKIIVSGRICNDLELKYTSNAKEYCQLNIAVTRDKEHTDFIKVATFGGTAKLISEYCKKGDKILVDGMLTSSQYEKNGMKITDYSVMANKVEFLELKKEETKEIKTVKVNPYEDIGKIIANDIEITDDDLPF